MACLSAMLHVFLWITLGRLRETVLVSESKKKNPAQQTNCSNKYLKLCQLISF
jgi:hypothetical protein